ncbi:MAG: hypothetical protein MJE66_00020 [Proteobacteria bacterium]|nr:hypothetical protein [Pseudomonadota bacterium]
MRALTAVGLAAAVLMTAFPLVAQEPEAEPEKRYRSRRVQQAFDRGGEDAVKVLMRDLVKRAKKSGIRYKCGQCHDNLRTYPLKPGAHEEFERLLQIVSAH